MTRIRLLALGVLFTSAFPAVGAEPELAPYPRPAGYETVETAKNR